MRGLLLFELDFVEAGAQHALGLGAILDLRFFVLAGDDQAGRQVRDAHRRIGRVHRLSAGARGAERIDAHVLRLDLDLDVVGFRQHRDRDGGRVDAALLFRRRHALDAMDAALVLELAVHFVAADEGDDFVQPADFRLARPR